MYRLKKTSRGISSLNCKTALQRSSCTGWRAPVAVLLVNCKTAFQRNSCTGWRAPVRVYVVLTVQHTSKELCYRLKSSGTSCLNCNTALQRSSFTGWRTPIRVYLVLTVKKHTSEELFYMLENTVSVNLVLTAKQTSEELLYRLKSISRGISCLYNIKALQRFM